MRALDVSRAALIVEFLKNTDEMISQCANHKEDDYGMMAVGNPWKKTSLDTPAYTLHLIDIKTMMQIVTSSREILRKELEILGVEL